MRDSKILAGDMLRQLREERGLSQAALAQSLGISASYLSQIESDQRPLARRLLPALTGLFGIKPAYFADLDDLHLAGDLREVAADPLFGGPAPGREIETMSRAAPEMSRRLLALYRSYLALEEEHQSLLGRLSEGEGETASRFPYDEVRDWVQSERNYFDPLDRAAERLAGQAGLAPGTRGEGFARYLLERHGIAVEPVSEDFGAGMNWRLDRASRRLLVAEGAPVESRAFWLAHVIGLLEEAETVERIVRGARLSNAEAEALARVGLANYYAGALMMPYGPFLLEARRLRHDVELLQGRFGASFEQICHRLSTMQRPSAPGIPFYFLKTDIAGNVLKRSSATRFQFARFGGPCPLCGIL